MKKNGRYDVSGLAEAQFEPGSNEQVLKNRLGEIYEWAGEYRRVNVSRGDFPFAAAARIPALMEQFERDVLARYTPCNLKERADILHALAETHAELVLIHPFREGNGRVARILSILMALQAGLPLLNFSLIAEEKKQAYFAAVQAGWTRTTRQWSGFLQRLSCEALRRREWFGFIAFFQHAGDGRNQSTRFDGGGTGDARNQRLAEFLRVAQIRVGLDERLLFHGQIIAKRGKPRNAECTMIDRNGGELRLEERGPFSPCSIGPDRPSGYVTRRELPPKSKVNGLKR